MGAFFWATSIAVWTFLYLAQVLSADRSLFKDLGLNTPLDVTKINISQDEYTHMMTMYLDARRLHSTIDSIPNLVTFFTVKNNWWPNRENTRLKFMIEPSAQETEIESAQLRFLAPALANGVTTTVRVKLLQVLGVRRRRAVEEKVLFLSRNLTKWCEFDVTSAVQSWLSGERNLGLELVCLDCEDNLKPIEAAISALVYPRRFRRRSNGKEENGDGGRTDCTEMRKGSKRKCCRHKWNVRFADLKFPEMNSIVAPQIYEANFCQGQCPPNYNHATNHSRIQSLLHMEGKTSKRQKRKAIPKACCTPSKLEPVEILRINPSNTSKLIMERWDNMKVVECACS